MNDLLVLGKPGSGKAHCLCALGEQSSVFEMGADIQGRDDDSGRHRPAGASQRGDRTQRPQLSTRDGQAFGPEGKGIRLTASDLSPNPGILIVAEHRLQFRNARITLRTFWTARLLVIATHDGANLVDAPNFHHQLSIR